MNNDPTKLRLAGLTVESTVDGPGLRFVIFTQGCPHRCSFCHNPDSWPAEGGAEMAVKDVIRQIKKHRRGKRGVTFSGGEPFLQAAALLPVAEAAHALGLDVVTYTGYTLEALEALSDAGCADTDALLSATDILIDGRYEHGLRDIGLPFRGSVNQRVIDMADRRAGIAGG